MGLHKNNKAFTPLEKDFLTGPAQVVGERSSLTGFTLMELITVVIITSIIAAFAIPNYQNSVEKAHEKDMVTNLRAIAAAEEIYRSENGTYWPTTPGLLTTAAINTALRLGIIENQTQYRCMAAFGTLWLCEGVYPYPGTIKWRVRIETTYNWQPVCDSGYTCPTCQDIGSGGCPN